MTKLNYSLLLALLLFSPLAQAQDFLGISTGNYAGVTGVSLQPASIVDSRYKFDINLFSISTGIHNNYLGLSKDALLKGKLFKKKYINDFDAIRRDLLTELDASITDKVRIKLNNRVQLPLSFMLTTGKNSAIALNIQSRTSLAVEGMNPELARYLYRGLEYPVYDGQTFDASGMKANMFSWLEVGFTYGHVLLNRNKHFLKAAATGKYLGGAAAGYLEFDNLKYSFVGDSVLSMTANEAAYNHSKNFDYKSFKVGDLKSSAKGWGMDVGIVYEYRGKIDKFRRIFGDGPDEKALERRDKNKYVVKLGASLLDYGKVSFDAAPLAGNFNADFNDWNFGNETVSSVSEFDTLWNAQVDGTTPTGSFSMGLPTAFSLQADLNLSNGFYLNAMGYWPVELDKNLRSMRAVRRFSVTPRWESKYFGVYLPLSYNEYKNFQLGTSLRLGPLFVGSSNAASVLFSDELSDVEVHLGLKVPIMYGKQSKLMKKFESIFSNDDESEDEDHQIEVVAVADSLGIDKAKLDGGIGAEVKEREIVVEQHDKGDGKIIVKKEVGKIAERGTPPPVSIVINNYINGDKVKSEVLRSDEIPAAAPAPTPARPTNDVDSLQRQIDYLVKKLAEKELEVQRLQEEIKKKNQLTPSGNK